MSSYSKINYTDVINQVRNEGWQIVSQSPDSTVIEKPVGIPRLVGIPLALIPIVGFLAAMAWIAIRGKVVVTIERKLTQARVVTPKNEYDINTPEDLDIFFNNFNFSGHMGYFPVVVIGLVVAFIGGYLVQFLGAG